MGSFHYEPFLFPPHGLKPIVPPIDPRFLLILSLSKLSLSAAEKPKVLIILADDLGISDLSRYGGEIPKSLQRKSHQASYYH